MPPSPTTATVLPALMRAVLMTAPMPVMTAQPKIATFSNGIFLSTLTIEFVDTTA